MGQDDAAVEAAAPDRAHDVEEADQALALVEDEAVEEVEAVVEVHGRRLARRPISRPPETASGQWRKGVAITMSPSQLGRYTDRLPSHSSHP